MREHIDIRVRSYFFGDTLEVIVRELYRDDEGVLRKRCATDFVWAEVPEGEAYPRTFQIPREAGQALMDNLWECGLRPTEGTGSAGAMAATQQHLADARKTAERLLTYVLDDGGGEGKKP